VFKVQNINKNTEKEEFIKLGINWSLTHTWTQLYSMKNQIDLIYIWLNDHMHKYL
jgi:hypothetical protein